MSDALDRWLAEQEAEAPDGFWGVQDCWLFAADWVWTRTGWDPAADLRGRYSTELGAARLIARAGGPEAFAGRLLGGVGWSPTARAYRGQVGLLPAVSDTNGVRIIQVAGVCLGGGWWASRTEDGLLIGQPRPTALWRPGR